MNIDLSKGFIAALGFILAGSVAFQFDINAIGLGFYLMAIILTLVEFNKKTR